LFAMKLCHLVLFLAVCAAALAVPAATTTATTAAPAPKKAVVKKTVTAKKTVAAKPVATKPVATKTGTARKTGKTAAGKATSGKAGTRTAARTWQPRQLTPTPDRYKEIQQALVTKGYLKSGPTGVWDAESVDALRQYQTDQKLTPTGKISAQSLIRLGLGPKTATSPLAPPAAAPPAPQP
jgi:hypothetical protein